MKLFIAIVVTQFYFISFSQSNFGVGVEVIAQLESTLALDSLDLLEEKKLKESQSSKNTDVIDFPDFPVEHTDGLIGLEQLFIDRYDFSKRKLKRLLKKSSIKQASVSFFVTPKGEITNIEIENSISEDINHLMIRIVEDEKWIPGEHMGKRSRFHCVLTYMFVIN